MISYGPVTEEHRRSPRVPLDADVLLEHGNRSLEGRSKDISLGGMFVLLNESLPFGAAITVRFRLPSGEGPMALQGIVRWERTDGVGVQFGPVGAKETFAITEWVRTAG